MTTYRGENKRLEAAWCAADLDCYRESRPVALYSVHEQVVNYTVPGRLPLLILAGPEIEKGPATIGLARDEFLVLREAAGKWPAGYFNSRTLALGNNGEGLEVSLQRGEKYSFSVTAPRCLDTDQLCYAVNRYTAMYKAILRKEVSFASGAALLGLPGGDDYFRQEIAGHFPRVVNALLTKNANLFISSCQKLIGMGRGATPEGDDLIHGALGAYHYLVNDLAFLDKIAGALRKTMINTNVMGRHMLESGLRGLIADPLHHFLESLVKGRPDKASLKKVLAIGSSSGHSLAMAIVRFTRDFTIVTQKAIQNRKPSMADEAAMIRKAGSTATHAREQWNNVGR